MRNLHAQEIDQLRQRQGDHGEVDAGAADRHIAHHQPHQRAHRQAGEQRQFRRQRPGLDAVAGHIAADAEKGGVAQGRQAGVAEQQMKRAGEQRVAKNLGAEHRVEPHPGGGHQGQQQEAVAHQASHSTPPNRPLGRTSSTSTMTRNITMEEASG